MSLDYCSLSALIKEPLYNAFMSGQHANRPVLTSTSMWCNNMKSRCSERCLYWKFSAQWLSVFPSAVAQVDGWDVSQEPGRGGEEAEQQSAGVQETTVPGQLWICLLKFGSISFPSPSSSVQETKNSRVQQQRGCKCFSVNIQIHLILFLSFSVYAILIWFCISLIPRPSHRPVFDRLHYAKTEGN